MRSFFFFIACLLSLSEIAIAADTFPGGTLSGSGGSFVDNNIGTTGEAGEPLTLGGGALNTQWYSWTAPTSGPVTIGTCNPAGSTLTNFDTTVGVYTGNAVNALTQIGFNDDTPGCNSTVNPLYASTVAFNAVAGTVYRIQVDGYANTIGQFNLFYGFSGYTTAVTTATATEAGVTGAFTVVLNAIPTGPATITVGTSPQCTFSPAVLNFTSANWNTPQTVTVTAIDDAAVEGTHFCAPATLTPSGGGVAPSAAPPPSITITDNDPLTVTIANTTNGAEAGPTNGVMTVTQTNLSSTNTVISYTVAGTATSGSDYTALSGTVTIPAGSTTATITIPVINDTAIEANETVIITLNAITSGTAVSLGTTVSATNTITSNDTATVSIANTTNGAEAGPVNGVMTVTQSAVSPTNTVISYTVAGSATSGTDYTALAGSVTILAGSTTATITIPVIDDAIVEANETVIVTLNAVTSGTATTLGTPVAATNTITSNDAATVSVASTTDGNETGPVNGVVTVTQTAASATNTVIAYTVSGTATSGSDFTALSGTVTIAAGSLTQTISIPVINDVAVEGSETVIITLTSITSGLATLGTPVVATNTILDNDAPVVTIANTTNGSEAGPVNGTMTVTMTAVRPTPVVISYTVSGTATSGTDFTALSGTVTIATGATTATISIPALDDLIVEGNETVIVTLTAVTSGAASLGATLIATNTIADNDSATISIANTTNGNETGPVSGVMTVTQTAVSATNTVIAYTVSGTATSGADFTALSGTVTILAGATSATISIPVIDDAVLDPSETVIITLSSISSGLPTLGTPVAATNTITDNDTASFTIAKIQSAGSNPVTLAGQTITFQVTIVNTGTVPLTAPSFTDVFQLGGSARTFTTGPTLSGDAAPVGTVNIGETWVYTATYTVPQADMDATGSYTNQATFDTAETPPSSSTTITTPVTRAPNMSINKSWSFAIPAHDANNIGIVDAGDIVTYSYQISNNGNVTINGVSVSDVHLGAGSLSAITPASVASLAPGTSANFTATYVVVQADIDNQ